MGKSFAEIQEVQQALVGAATAGRGAEGVQSELLERETEARELAEKANRTKDEFIVEESVSTLVQAEHTGEHHVRVETMPVWGRADADRLEQVVNSLLVNALKYTPEGGTIEVRCEPAVEGARKASSA